MLLGNRTVSKEIFLRLLALRPRITTGVPFIGDIEHELLKNS